MNIIQENPYRIVGIVANSSEKELQRQKSKLLRYASIGREVTSEFDFSFFNKIERSESMINAAFSKIEQNQDKINNALFWFLNINLFDETAITHLVHGDMDKSIEIWEKVTSGKEISAKNFSYFNNIATIKLLSNEINDIKEGIRLKTNLILSEAFTDFVYAVADQTYNIDPQKELERLVDSLLTQLTERHSNNEIIHFFKSSDKPVLDIFYRKFTKEPIHNIESQISKTSEKRKNDTNNAYALGLKLYEETKKDLETLKSILGKKDITYEMVADNLAKEIMQCGIDYFIAWKETKDPSTEALQLLNLAQETATQSQTSDRIKENIKGIEEWLKTSPIKEELDFITQKINGFQQQSKSISNIKLFITTCKPMLDKIRDKVGKTDPLYQLLSGGIVNLALSTLISIVNREQESIKYAFNKQLALNTLKPIIKEALEVSYLIGKLDMSAEIQTHYNNNHNILISIASQLGLSTFNSNSGCLSTILVMVTILVLLIFA